MIILIGPSASGKTTIAKELIKNYNFNKFITNTTRKMRDGEENHVDYHFISKEDFLNKIKENKLIEYMEYNDNYYGTSIEDVSFNKVLIVDINGANKFYDKLKDEVVIFYITCDNEIIKKRMKERGDSDDVIAKRLAGDSNYFDIKKLKHYDYIIHTDKESNEEITKDIYHKYINQKRGKYEL